MAIVISKAMLTLAVSNADENLWPERLQRFERHHHRHSKWRLDHHQLRPARAPANTAPGIYAIDAVLSDLGTGKLARDYDVTILAGSLTVAKDGTTTRVSSSMGKSDFGLPVTLTASVTASAPGGGTATGTVSFYDGTTILGTSTLSSGVASITAVNLSAAAHGITVHYNGDADFLVSTSPALTETVLSAVQQTSLLLNQVIELRKSRVLKGATGLALKTTLDSAIARFNKGDNSAAIPLLKTFIGKVDALRFRGLSSSKAQPLIEAADRAIASIKRSRPR